MPHRAMTRIKNAPSSVIAYGDATFPPCGGKALGVRFTGFPPLGGKLSSEARLMRGLTEEPRADGDIRPCES